MSIVQRLRNPALGEPEEANWGTGNQGFKEPIPGELSIHAPPLRWETACPLPYQVKMGNCKCQRQAWESHFWHEAGKEQALWLVLFRVLIKRLK